MYRKNLPILIAGLLSIAVIVFSIWYVRTKDEREAAKNQPPAPSLDSARGIVEDDHILGNPGAPIVFYVYSDFSCPYCKDFHKSMKLLLELFGKDGNVAWVFRHTPFVQLHPESPMYALASECVAEEAGNVGFWKFADDLFEQANPLKPYTAAELVTVAESAGADRQTFVACMRENKYMGHVESEFQEAMAAGAKGTPFTIIETPSGRTSYQGAQSFKAMAIAVQTAIRTLESDGQLHTPSEKSDFTQDFQALEGGTTTIPAATPTAATSSSL